MDVEHSDEHAGCGTADYRVLAVGEVYAALCAHAPGAAAVRLAMSCRTLQAALARRPEAAYAFARPRLLGQVKPPSYLRARWRRFGRSGPEVDEALAGAVRGRNVGVVRWLAPGVAALAPPPSAAAIEAVAAGLVEMEVTCELLAAYLSVVTSWPAVLDAFVGACAAGKLGLAQAAYRRLAILQPDERKKSLILGRSGACHSHVSLWISTALRPFG